MDNEVLPVGDENLDVSPLSSLRSHVEEAIAFAGEWDEPFRGPIFEAALAVLLRGSEPLRPAATLATVRTMSSAGSVLEARQESVSPLERLAQAMSVDAENLARAVSIGPDGAITILGRLDARTRADLQQRYSALYCYIKEKALGQQQVDIEELRELCIRHGCYDQANFAATYRRGDLLRGAGGRGRERNYVASRSGLELGETLLRDLLES